MSNSRSFDRRHSRAELPPTTEDLIERAVNEARKLPSYDADSAEESTARHNIPPNIHFDVHVSHPSQPDHDSSPQIEIGPLKARNLPKWLVVTLAAIVAAGTALLARLSSR